MINGNIFPQGGGGSGGGGGVVQVNTYNDLPTVGKSDILYITKDTNTGYYWEDTQYQELTAEATSILFSQVSGSPYDNTALATALNSKVSVTTLATQQDANLLITNGMFLSGSNLGLTHGATGSGNWSLLVDVVNGYIKQWFSSPTDSIWYRTSAINGDFTNSTWSRVATNGDIDTKFETITSSDSNIIPTYENGILNLKLKNIPKVQGYTAYGNAGHYLTFENPTAPYYNLSFFVPNAFTANRLVTVPDASTVLVIPNTAETNKAVSYVGNDGVQYKISVVTPPAIANAGTLAKYKADGQLEDTGVTLSIDPNSNSDSEVISSKAVTTKINNAVSSVVEIVGTYDASSNLFPTTGGSGAGGAIKKGDLFYIIVNGTLGGTPVYANLSSILAVYDTPEQDKTKWVISEGYKLSSETTNGIMRGIDYVKLLWSNTAVKIYDADINSSNQYQILPEYAHLYVYTTAKTPDILLPNFLTNPAKTSYEYDGDTLDISNNQSSINVINIKCLQMVGGKPIQIIDPTAGAVTQLVIQPNTKVTFRWSDNNPDPLNRTKPVQWEIMD